MGMWKKFEQNSLHQQLLLQKHLLKLPNPVRLLQQTLLQNLSFPVIFF
jgi:hypothetical protein